jgi:hypothetical protein
VIDNWVNPSGQQGSRISGRYLALVYMRFHRVHCAPCVRACKVSVCVTTCSHILACERIRAHTSGAHCNIRLPSRALLEATCQAARSEQGQTLATLDWPEAESAEDGYGAVLGASERVPILLQVNLYKNEQTRVRGHV